MLIDRPQVAEGSVIVNATVPSGISFPSSPNAGELFFRTDLSSLQAYNGSAWLEAGSVALTAHIADVTLHLTSVQNTLLDNLSPALTSGEVNALVGVTSSIQTQINASSGSFSTHIADDTRHLTAAQNTLIDGITVSSTELNYTTGANSPLQGQINTINALNTTQNTRLTTLENTTVPAVQTNLNAHAADDTRHLTTAQNTLIDAITVSAADINKLSGAAGLTSSVKLSLDQLAGSDYSTKISANGSIGMSGNLALGGNRITGLGAPTVSTDAATKDYVDSFVQGLHWVGSVKAASTVDLALAGFQTVDGVPLTNSDRVLVKDQSTPANNGIYLVASGAWSRSNDFNAAIEVNNSAVFVLAGGGTQGKSTWVQTSTVNTLGSDPISFSAFSGPVINQAGSGITLGSNGLVAVKEGAGQAFDGNGALIVDVYAGGGLMITTNNTTASPLTTVAAQLALTQSGVAAGSYGTATQAPTFTVDAKGRLTAASTVTITPAFSSITSLPSTLAGHGITDAVLKTGDTMSGNLIVAPAASHAQLVLQRASAATGQAVLTLSTISGALAGTWQLYNQTGSSNFGIYSSIYGNDIMSMTTAGATTFIGSVQAASFIGNATSATIAANAISLGGVSASDTMQYRGGVLAANIDTATLNGFYTQQNAGDSSGVLTFNPSGSLGPTQIRITYQGVLEFRNKTDSLTWTSWRQVLTNLNFNSYAPTLTGTGASGTWGINITGSASSASNATTVTSITSGQVTTALGFTPYNATNPAGYISSAALSGYAPLGGAGTSGTWPISVSGNSITTSQRTFDRVNTSGITQGSYGGISISGNTGGYSGINFSDYSATLMVHGSISGLYRNNNTWDWYWDNGTLIVGTVPGANVSGTVANATNATNATLAAKASTLAQGGGNGAAMTFNWSGQGGQPTWLWGSNDGVNHYVYNPSNFSVAFATNATSATNAGTVTHNHSRGDGAAYPVVWMPAANNQPAFSCNAVTITSSSGTLTATNLSASTFIGAVSTTNFVMANAAFSGSIVAQGDVTAFSDRRLKTNIEPIHDALWKVEQLEGITFKRINDDSYGTGLIAQDVQAVMPEAVTEHEDGMLSVAYGNLAGLFVEAIKALNKEVVELRAELKILKDAQ